MIRATFIGMKATVIGGIVAAALVLIAVTFRTRDAVRMVEPAPGVSTAAALPVHEGLLYGRVTMEDGQVFEGRLRWGGDEEALWSNYFNGFKDLNAWAALVPPDELPVETRSLDVFGFNLFRRESRVSLGRPFMVRFGDIARIEPRGRDLRVTLRSGTTVNLDRYAADDLADGLRVWDASRGIVDLGEWKIRRIEFLAAPAGSGPSPLYGTVRTGQGDFTGLIQWDREAALVTDRIEGISGDDAPLSFGFDGIRSIERRPEGGSLVTLVDGGQVVLSGTRDVGQGNRGMYVDDQRYGRVLVSWAAFESVEFGDGGTGPAYDSFEPGRPLMGTVVTRAGDRLSGRLVYDLDESETNETLDAPSGGIDFTIPFGRIESIVLPDPGADSPASVVLLGGDVLDLELSGDLSAQNAGMLVFVDGVRQPGYVPWAQIRQIDFDVQPPR